MLKEVYQMLHLSMVHRVKHRREREEEAHKDEAAALTSK
jgi:hypothetical protein